MNRMASADDVLVREVYVGDAYKPFGELTAQDARALAEQFSGLSGGGLEQKVAPVGRAWRELADASRSAAPRRWQNSVPRKPQVELSNCG